MTLSASEQATVPALDLPTRQLIRLAAVVSAGSERDMRTALGDAARGPVDPIWVEELILQSYLFAGFPRSLNAAREWRRASGRSAPDGDEGAEPEAEIANWRARGEDTCAVVYGPFYEALRKNIRDLHPALDSWMIVDGYGKVLGRPGLNLWRRELCVVAACAACGQDRQLHSHLHGAMHAGASVDQVGEALSLLDDLIDANDASRYRLLFARVVAQTR
ncbi:MAG TPA: carboxymuconolactone decarboxylase family protein [Gemmatimonadaceae bacterium]|nr:carboxymuconolactone decarboxylase family protein [Gemmatimonadaceae bacterium]